MDGTAESQPLGYRCKPDEAEVPGAKLLRQPDDGVQRNRWHGVRIREFSMMREGSTTELFGELRALRYRAWRVVPFADMEAKAYWCELEESVDALSGDRGEAAEQEVRPLLRRYRRLCDRAEGSWNLMSGNLWGPP